MTQKQVKQYLNEEKVNRARLIGIIMAIIGGSLLLEGIFAYASMLSETSSGLSFTAENIASLISILGVILFVLLIPYLLFSGGIRRIHEANLAEKYNEVFANDTTGYLLASDLAATLRISNNRIGSQMRTLIKRDYLKNVQLVEGDPTCILLVKDTRSLWRSACYLNERNAFDVQFNNGFTMYVWGLFSLAILVFLPVIFVTSIKNGSTDDYSFAFSFLLMAALLVYLWYVSFRSRARIRRAGFYNQYLEDSANARVTLRSLAERLGLSSKTVERDVHWLFGKQILKGCRLDVDEDTSLLLEDVSDGKAEFAAVSCDGCGATSRIRMGRVGKCSYCGRFLAAPLGGSHKSVSTVKYTPRTFVSSAKAGTYLNQDVLAKMEGKKNSLRFYGILLIFLGCSTFISLLRFLPETHKVISAVSSLLYCTFIVVPGILLLRRGLLHGDAAHFATLCDPLFGQSEAPELSVEEIAQSLGMTPEKVKSLLLALQRQDALKNFYYNEGIVRLTDSAHGDYAYRHTTCKHCGAPLTIKRGFVALCRYCGSYVDENGQFHDKDDKNEQAIVLRSAGENRGAVIAYIRDLTGMNQEELNALLSELPTTIAKTGATGAARIRSDLKKLGAEADE